MLVKDQYAKDSGAWCNLNQPGLTEKDVDVVIFGIPFDEGVSYRSGASEGPMVLRKNTFSSTPYTEQFESIEDLKVYDAGDFQCESREQLFMEVADYVRELVKSNIFFTAVGGDHSVTIPIEKGIDLALNESFGIIHIDGTDNLYFIGIRSIEPDEYQFKKQNKINVASSYECHKLGIQKIAEEAATKMSKYNKVYITLDIDCLDPAFAAGTGTPQFGGLYSRQLLDLLEILFSKLNIIAFDVVEVAPALDPSLTSMFAARKIITECWGYRARKLGLI